MLRATLPGIILAVLGAAGTSAVSALVAVYSASYVSWDVIGLVTAFWCAVALLGGIVAGGLVSPLVAFLKGRSRLAILPGLVVALVFLVNALVAKGEIETNDPIGKTAFFNVYFITAWAILLGVITGVLIVQSKHAGDWGVTSMTLLSVLVTSGLAYFVWKEAGAFTYVVGPLALSAITVAILDRLRTAALRGAAVAVVAVLYSAALFVAAVVAGEKSLQPIDRGVAPAAMRAAALPGKPNVIVITIDTARADRMSLCGYKYPTTPELVKFAADSQFFPFGTSVDSWTLPAHASLFTGKYPREHGAHAASSARHDSIERARLYGIPLAKSQLTLATYMSMKGYNTGAFCGNYAWLCRQFGLDQGFNYFYDLPRWLIFTPGGCPVYNYGIAGADLALGANGKLVRNSYSAQAMSEMAAAWVRKNKEAPFFLFVNYMDPHEPYAPPPPFDHMDGADIPFNRSIANHEKWQAIVDNYIKTGQGLTEELAKQASNQYDGELAYADHWIGRLMDDLKAEGVYDDTLIVITSDHGEFFGEHQLLDHGSALYEGGIRIPILVKYPQGKHAGEVVNDRVSIIDVFPTVFEVAGLQAPPSSGQTLQRVEHPIIAEQFEDGMRVSRYGDRFKRDLTASYSGDLKLIDSSAGSKELYDLKTDPAESNNIADGRTEALNAMYAQLTSWKKQTAVFDGTKEQNATISPEMLERLESLGYVSPSSAKPRK